MPAATAEQIRVHEMEAVVCSPAMRRLMAMVERVAASNAAVLITGETGSGKELIARAIHHHSLRTSRAWVDVNCAAIPEHLVESELFGYEKGAFSGADTAKPGLFELADKGTLFLDEIGELEPRVQVKLLRVLDGVPYYRLGGRSKVSVDVRLIAATNQPLEQAVSAGRFRSDLFHRLGQIQLRVPPLRERPEDVLALSDYFLQQAYPGRRFSAAAAQALTAYSWPGNIRELRNLVLQLGTLCYGAEIDASDLPPEIREAGERGSSSTSRPATELAEVEKQTILRALEKAGGHQGLASEELGISRRTLIRKLKQYRQHERAADGPAMGSMGAAQQAYFRVAVEVPVTVTCPYGEYALNITNVSVGGIAISGVKNPFQLAGGITVAFNLPGLAPRIEARGQVVWADVNGCAGVRFVEIAPELERELKTWVRRKQMEEGWSLR